MLNITGSAFPRRGGVEAAAAVAGVFFCRVSREGGGGGCMQYSDVAGVRARPSPAVHVTGTISVWGKSILWLLLQLAASYRILHGW